MKILITEEQFKTLSGYLMEQLSPDEIYQKYYSKIDKNIFDKIIEADPKTVKGIKVGNYAKILINIYRKGGIKIVDLPQASYYLSLAYKHKRSIPNNVETLTDILNIVKDKVIKDDSPIKDVLEQLINGVDYDMPFESSNWWVFIPKTRKGAAYLSVNTEWCTTYGEHSRNPALQRRCRNEFEDYNKDGHIYIIINKLDETEKYQVHLELNEFMNKKDKPFNFKNLLENNKDLKDFFVDFGYKMIDNYIKNGSVGSLRMVGMFIRTLGDIEEVDGLLDLTNCEQLLTLWKLRTVKNGLRLDGCKSLKSLGELEEVGDYLSISYAKIGMLNNLRKVGDDLKISDCENFFSFSYLESVGKDLKIYDCPLLKSLGFIKSIGGDLVITNCPLLKDLGKLQTVVGKIFLRNTPLADMYKSGKLEQLYPQFKGKFVV